MFNFYVSVHLSDAELGVLPIFQHLSHLQEAKIRSKSFDSYKECTDHAQKFTTDVVELLNANGGSYFIQPAFNPELEEDGHCQINGIGNLSNWSKSEIFRFYVVSHENIDKNGSFLTKLVVSVLSNNQNKKEN